MMTVANWATMLSLEHLYDYVYTEHFSADYSDFCKQVGMPEYQKHAYLRDQIVSKVVGENVLQMMLQTSYFSLTFQYSSLIGKVKLIASIGLGMFSAVSKVLRALVHWPGNLHDICDAIRDQRALYPDERDLAIILVSVLFVVVGFAYIVSKLYFTFQCSGHVWGITTGCLAASEVSVTTLQQG